jgi:hypothetical protein
VTLHTLHDKLLAQVDSGDLWHLTTEALDAAEQYLMARLAR